MNTRERWSVVVAASRRSLCAGIEHVRQRVGPRRVWRRQRVDSRSVGGRRLRFMGGAAWLRDRVVPGATWLGHRLVPVLAIALLVLSMGGTWHLAGAAPKTIAEEIAPSEPEPARPVKKSARELTGKLNLNTATAEQLELLPTVGPAKAARVVAWRARNGGFRRIADLRRVKGFGYKTFKRLAPLLDIRGETTLK